MAIDLQCRGVVDVRTALRDRRSRRCGGRGGRLRTRWRGTWRGSPRRGRRRPHGPDATARWRRCGPAASRAVYRSLHSAARTPRTLLAASCSPCPLPPMTMPTVRQPVAHGAPDGGADRRVVGGDGASRCRGRSTSWPCRCSTTMRCCFSSYPAWSAADGDRSWHGAESYGPARRTGALLARAARDDRSAHARPHRRRPVPAPRRRPRRRAGAGAADGARRSSPPPPTPASPVRRRSTRSASSARCRGSTATRRWVIAQRLGLSPRELAYTTTGGNSPQSSST